MKNPILRTLMGAILFSLISSIVISSIGYMLGWKTTAQFSDGFFWVGFLLIAIGIISYQGYSRPTLDWPPIHLGPAARAHLYMEDSFHGNNIMVFLGISGLLLFGLSILVQSLL